MAHKSGSKKRSTRGVRPGQTKTQTMIRGSRKGQRMKMKAGPSGHTFPVKRKRK
ncbi:hypothetical protein LCGC14_2548620 [marine sediment metagenome]|uniref:Uncharacterized protein n=1 Tax=marine sediment metagenome TaxID=412755 RepID=A0A0F9BBD0_9ZZZZ